MPYPYTIARLNLAFPGIDRLGKRRMTFQDFWNGKLVHLSLPSDKPASRMTMYKHIEGDIFKRIKDNDELGAEVEFIRDNSGNVYKSKSHQNYATKMGN